MRTLRLAAALMAACASSQLFAAETATVMGRVTDTSGAVVPGATVTARNVDTGIARSAATDAGGSYRIPVLPPGAYEFTATAAGLASVRRAGVRLHIGAEVVLDFELKPASISEQLTVVADAPVVDTTDATVQTIVKREAIDILPLVARDWQSLARLAPGAVVTGGEGVSFTGSRGRANQYLIDGVDNSDDFIGFHRQEFNLDAIEEFQVLVSNFKAEYGRASGATFNVLSRSGTNQYHGSAFFLYRDQDTIARDPFLSADEPEDPFRRLQGGAALGGPIVPDRTHFFVSYDHEDRKYSVVTTRPYPRPGAAVSPAVLQFLEQNDVPPFPDTGAGTRVRLVRPEYFKNPQVTARLDHQIDERHALTFRFNYDRERVRPGQGGTIQDADGADYYFRHAYGSLAHKWVRSPSQINQAYVQVGQTHGDWSVRRPALTNIFVDEFSSATSYLGGPTTFPANSTAWIFQFIDNYTIHRTGWSGDHVFKMGGDLKFVRDVDFADINFRGSYFFRTVDDFLAGRPRRFTQNQGDSRADLSTGLFAFYLQDDWRVHPRLTLNLGLRYDYENGKTDALSDVPEGSPACALTLACGEAGPGISGDTNNLSPRFGFVLDVFGNQKTALHGGAGLYYDRIILLIPRDARFTPPKIVGIQIENPSFPDPFVTGTRAALRPNLIVIDPNLKTPVNLSSSIGVRQALTDNVGLDATFVWNTGRDQVLIINNNSIDPATGQRPNADFTNVNTYTNEGEIRYRGLLLELRRRMANGYSWTVAYTLAKSENNAETTFRGIQDPRDIRRSFGPSDEGRRHILAASFIGRLPFGIDVGAIFDYWSERPLNIFAGGRDLNGDGITGDWPEGYSRNQRNGRALYDLPLEEANRLRQLFNLAPIERFDDNDTFVNVDLTVQKKFGLGASKGLKLTAELFNAFDTQNNAVPTTSVTSSLFGQVTSLTTGHGARPRSLQLTAQFEF